MSLKSATGPVRLTATAERPVVRATGGDLAYVTLALTDDQGICHNGADRPVSVEVSGAGVLLGYGSAAPSTEERFDTSEQLTYGG
ncbi:glycoside hydrolase family 2, partial [Streptomyces sp. NPDC050263]